MIVLRGLLRVEHDGGALDVRAGEGVVVQRGERVRYSTPGEGAEYVASAFRRLAGHRQPRVALGAGGGAYGRRSWWNLSLSSSCHFASKASASANSCW